MTIIELTRNRRLRVEHAFLWLLAALLILFLTLFKDLADVLAQRLDMGHTQSLIVAIAFILLTLNQLVLSVIISSLVQKNCDLAQKVAELEWHINQLRKKTREQERQEHTVWPIAVTEDQLPVREEATTPL
jgi:membrane protein insertase Oxa1/YidC/SpoIIIJ